MNPFVYDMPIAAADLIDRQSETQALLLVLMKVEAADYRRTIIDPLLAAWLRNNRLSLGSGS